MARLVCLAWVLCTVASVGAVVPPPVDSLALAAEYYFSHHDYRQSLDLWSEILKRDPINEKALVRTSDLKLLLEGRASARDALLSVLDNPALFLSTDARKVLRDRLSILQNAFLTDEGQATYLQALPKIKRGDCAGALGLLNQAAIQEKGNVRVLREKARCELHQGLYVKYYATVQQAHENNPFDLEILDGLLEAEAYYREYPKIIALARKYPDDFRSLRQKMAYGIALVETGEDAAAVPLLQSVVEAQKSSVVSPIVLYALGRAFAKKPDTKAEAIGYLDRFLISGSRPEFLLVDGWDPYHSPERLEEAQKLVTSLKAPHEP